MPALPNTKIYKISKITLRISFVISSRFTEFYQTLYHFRNIMRHYDARVLRERQAASRPDARGMIGATDKGDEPSQIHQLIP